MLIVLEGVIHGEFLAFVPRKGKTKSRPNLVWPRLGQFYFRTIIVSIADRPNRRGGVRSWGELR
jgi:hypothetical protein